MSEKAIVDMLGFPVTDTEWGKGRQLLYSESLVLYLNAERRLVQLKSPGIAQSGDLSGPVINLLICLEAFGEFRH